MKANRPLEPVEIMIWINWQSNRAATSPVRTRLLYTFPQQTAQCLGTSDDIVVPYKELVEVFPWATAPGTNQARVPWVPAPMRAVTNVASLANPPCHDRQQCVRDIYGDGRRETVQSAFSTARFASMKDQLVVRP
jgi:hypothetical protein